MNRFPWYNPPFQYYNPYRRNNINKSHIYKPMSNPPTCDTYSKKETFFDKTNKDDFWLDIFGIKLYYDDVLILSLLFFLYKEEVKDEWLFLALVLLLIS